MAEQFDEFLDEVQNDIKQERYRQLWDKYGKAFTTAVTGVIAAAAAYMLWQNHETRMKLKASEALLTAESEIEQGRLPEAFAVLNTIKEPHNKTYGYLRDLEKAHVLLSEKEALKKKEGAAMLEKMKNDASLPSHISQYAALLYTKAALELKIKTENEIIELLKPLRSEKNPWRYLASETLGGIFLTQKKYQDALEVFADLNKQVDLPEGMRMRIHVMTQVASQHVSLK